LQLAGTGRHLRHPGRLIRPVCQLPCAVLEQVAGWVLAQPEAVGGVEGGVDLVTGLEVRFAERLPTPRRQAMNLANVGRDQQFFAELAARV